MSHTFMALVWICLMQLISGLSIEAVTPAVKLTRIFTQQNYSKISNMMNGYMTYYIDPNDATNTPYLWLGANFQINGSTMASYVSSEVFTTLFTEYAPINGPLDIVNELAPNNTNGYDDQLVANMMCTSPVTKDIMTCWANVTWINDNMDLTYQIGCRLFFVKSKTFSDIIQVANHKTGINFGMNVFCFNDSYFFPYSHTVINVYNITPSDVTLYGTVIDLKGQIKYSDVELKNLGIAETFSYFVPVYGVTAYEFNPREVDSRASSVFSLNYAILNLTTNVTHIVGLYAYYTSIDDTRFPIYIYNQTELKSHSDANAEIDYAPNAVINWNGACCYISMYSKSDYNNNSQTIYGMITDTHGSKIDIAQYPHYEDVVLIADASPLQYEDVTAQIIDLPMISDDSVHYFGVLYSKTQNWGEYYANSTAIRVYYLQYDENTEKFDLLETGDFDTVMLTNDFAIETNDIYFGTIGAYNLPGTDYICFTWTEDGYVDVDNHMYYDMFGQTFLVH